MKKSILFGFLIGCLTMLPAVTNAAVAACVNADENQKLLILAARGDKQSLAILQQKAAKNDFCAKFSLAGVYGSGDKKTESEKLKKEALSEAKTAAQAGDLDAQHLLGQYSWYAQRDYKTSIKWESSAANAGHADAQRVMGEYYAFNLSGEDGNETKGLSYLKQSAEKGNSGAMYALGCFYDQPYHKDNDLTEAAKWYRMAAEKGFAPAYHELSDMYANGEGVPQSWKISYFWGCLSEKCFDNPKREARGLVMSNDPRINGDPRAGEDHLDQSQIDEIKKAAAAWQPGTPPPIEEPGFFQKIWCSLHTPC